jgi:hypothetical protein
VDDDGWLGRGKAHLGMRAHGGGGGGAIRSEMPWAGCHGPSRGLEKRARSGNFLYFLNLFCKKYHDFKI